MIKELERIRRNFQWGGNEKGRKLNKIAWRKACQSKEKGGMGLGLLIGGKKCCSITKVVVEI